MSDKGEAIRDGAFHVEEEERSNKRAKQESACHTTTDTKDTSPSQEEALRIAEEAAAQASRLGRWSLDEKIMFLYGLSLYGKGRWKKIHAYVPDRSLVQIKSHAQKVLKRLDAGENVFRRLDDNRDRVKLLVAEANSRIHEEQVAKAQAMDLKELAKKKRKRTSTRKQQSQTFTPLTSSFDHIDAAMEAATAALEERHTMHHHDRPSNSGSPVPSLLSASHEDPPGSYQYSFAAHEEFHHLHPTLQPGYVPPNRSPGGMDIPLAGTGAVIAAVAALCQLSASGET